jgi:hypothetical protein
MSEERDPRCVHVAPDLATANHRAAWLGEKGFLCEVVAPDPPEEGAAPAAGVEIRVLDVDQAAKARDTIDLALEHVDRLRKRLARTGTVTATCEECGKSSEWPAADMGSTQECPHCARYMDVPDPDDDWGDVDVGTEDEEPPPADPKAAT